MKKPNKAYRKHLQKYQNFAKMFVSVTLFPVLRKTVNDNVLMEGQMEPLPSQNNFVQYVKVTEVHLGIPEHLLISVSWTNEKEVVFLVCFFFK